MFCLALTVLTPVAFRRWGKKSEIVFVLGHPQDHPHVRTLARRTQRTQHKVVLITKVYYSNIGRIHRWMVKGKDTWGV